MNNPKKNQTMKIIIDTPKFATVSMTVEIKNKQRLLQIARIIEKNLLKRSIIVDEIYIEK